MSDSNKIVTISFYGDKDKANTYTIGGETRILHTIRAYYNNGKLKLPRKKKKAWKKEMKGLKITLPKPSKMTTSLPFSFKYE